MCGCDDETLSCHAPKQVRYVMNGQKMARMANGYREWQLMDCMSSINSVGRLLTDVFKLKVLKTPVFASDFIYLYR